MATVLRYFMNIPTPAPVLNPPAAVSNLSVIAGDTQASLSWSAPNDGGSAITNYHVEYKLTSAGTWSQFSTPVSPSTGAVVTSLTNDSSYDFRVFAVNIIGTSPSSNVAAATPTGVAPTGNHYYDLAMAAYPSFTATRTVQVSNRAQLLAAFLDLQDGDDIVMITSTDYGEHDLDGISAATMTRLRPAAGITATFRSSGSAPALYMRRGADNWIIGHPDGQLILDGDGTALSSLGVGLSSGTATSGSGKGPVTNVYFSNVLITDAGQTGVKCGVNSSYITWDELCHITNTGLVSPEYGEGLYIGSASGGGDLTTNIVYRGEISSTSAEGIDAKVDSEVSAPGVRIHDIQMNSNGVANKGGIANRSGKLLDAPGARIWNIKRAGGAPTGDNDPVGAMCSSGTLTLDGAAIWDCGGAALWVFDSGDISADQLTAFDNNTQSQSSRDFAVDGSSGQITISNSVYNGTHQASLTATSVATSGDFVGPITGAAIGADGLPGTGFTLASSSSIPSSRGAFGAE